MKTFVLAMLLFITCSGLVMGQYQNVRISLPNTVGGMATYNHEEVTISINPQNPMQLAAGANMNMIYLSTDGGFNWTQDTITSIYGVWGDPVVRFDAAGHLYYSHLSNPPYPGYWIDRIVVQKSMDAGQTWNDDVGVGYNPPVKNQDKEWLAVDMTSGPNHNNLYMCWTEFDEYGNSNPVYRSRIRFSRSIDHGVTWDSAKTISDITGNCVDEDSTVEGAVPAVGPNGEIYASWSGPLGIMFDKSSDGGITWGADIFVTDQPGGWDFMVDGIQRCNGMPITLCDISSSPYQGNVYVIWSDQRNGLSNTDVFFIKSTDGGQTWHGLKRVHDDVSNRHQFFPWATVDPVTGIIYVVFYDRRATSNLSTEVWMARSRDGGETFENFKISQTEFQPTGSVFFGDYIDIAAYDRHVRPIWMRMDGGKLSVWTAIIEDTSSIVDVSALSRNPKSFYLSQNYPNPFNPSTQIRFALPAAADVRLKVFNALGQEVATLADGRYEAGSYTVRWNAQNFASGVYLYRLQAGRYSDTRKMILIK